jgi:sugar transferase EpsL
MKRTLDILVAAIGLVVACPLVLLLMLFIYWRMGRPVFFRQLRPGLGGRPFQLLKLRSMVDAYDSFGNLLPDSERLDGLGRFLRRSSLDELPQLWNVLVGDMSLVGPRPLLLEYLPLYSPEQGRRHDVRPGITGWAQVNGRNAISWQHRLALDVWYVDHQSIYLDIKIIIMTVGRVFSRADVSPLSGEIMPKFTGQNNEASQCALVRNVGHKE